MKKRTLRLTIGGALLCVAALFLLYTSCGAPTRILLVNALPAQATDWMLNNDCEDIQLTCLPADEVRTFAGYNAIVLFSRGLFLSKEQTIQLEQASKKGVPIFTNAWRDMPTNISCNLTEGQQDTLMTYFRNGCKQNCRNALRYLRRIASRGGRNDEDVEAPVTLPKNLYYHLKPGHYFQSHQELTDYLKQSNLYHEGGRKVAFISGVTFPMEGNRAHVDSLVSRMIQAGYNVYPLSASGVTRDKMIRALHPDAVVYLPMGRLGNDSLIAWLHEENIPLLMPFPLMQPSDEWKDADKPVTGGTLTARVVVPEIDGGIAPYCIATQEENAAGYLCPKPEMERVERFVEYMKRYLALRNMPNKEKRVAICYFKSPGNDALLASGMEVVPSLYHFLKTLRAEGYRVEGLPEHLTEFARRIAQDGAVIGSYAKGAQERFLHEAHPIWLTKQQYEQWAQEILLPEKYQEVVDRYGDAPGALLAQGDSIAIACLQFGNVCLFPQPRPALGEDEFQLAHGMKVAPPHSYLAPYLYVQKGFQADALIHFGTHGNLEFTPGKNVGQSQADWSDVLAGAMPHFYFYTTGNVGEGIIAKRRTHAVLVTYLTPPYVESGLRQRYASFLDDIHRLLAEGVEQQPTLALQVKREAIRLGLHRDLGLDSLPDHAYSVEELERLDSFTEEIANEKVTGAYYTLGKPYSSQELMTTTLAVAAEELAYQTAKHDAERGKISQENSQDFDYLSHHYLPQARERLTRMLEHLPSDTLGMPQELRPAWLYWHQLAESTSCEMKAMLRALDGGTVWPAPGGDPVLNPNVLPTGRNMYSINAEATPNPRAWEEGKRLAEATLENYRKAHGEYPRQVSYSFWAGEFISTEGATLAQAFYMLGVEPVRDKQGRVVDIKLIPARELGRPRVQVMVQVSGQLRDIAASRLSLLTQAIRLAAEAEEDGAPNYVHEGTLRQEKRLMQQGLSPKRARELATMRVFGPVNNGYSTGLLGMTENSGDWKDKREIVQGYLNNMGATYGDEAHWGDFQPGLLAAALAETDVVVQPRQSNTWGPLSLDHVYEFAGGLSLAVQTLTGKEPEAYLADYRSRFRQRMQDLREAVAVEARATLLNPTYIRQRMEGGAGTAQMFGELFRNVFGWEVMRPSALNEQLLSDLYRIYVNDEYHLGLHDYFRDTNPAALQSMTAVLLECARKGYWKASAEELSGTTHLHVELTQESGAACTEFVCANQALHAFITNQLPPQERSAYEQLMKATLEPTHSGKEVVLKQQQSTSKLRSGDETKPTDKWLWLVALLALLGLAVWLHRKRKRR